MRHALLGGTFDPIHRGHIHAAMRLAEICHLDRITLLPSAAPPHKQEKVLTSFKHRYAMAQRAIENNPLFDISDYEMQQGGLSYTIATALHFKKRYPEHKLFFIMGNDMAAIFSTWKSWPQLLEIVEPLVVQRQGEPREIDPRLPPAIRTDFEGYYRQIQTLPISSTMVRSKLVASDFTSATPLLTPSVLMYIKEHNLYVQNMQS